MKRWLLALLFTIAGSLAWAGPDDASRFDDAPLGAQKTVYQFNLERPEDLLQGLGYVSNHVNGLKEFGDLKQSHIVVVAHGNELHMLSRLNRAAYPDVYERLKALAAQGVSFRVCRNAAKFRGYKPEDFYDVVTVVPAAMTELAKWQHKGYAYINAATILRTKRADFLEKHPEIIE